MSEAEYKIMKDQLRQELLDELRTARLDPLPWGGVRRLFDQRTRHLGAHRQYVLNTAFCTVMRYRYDLRTVTLMTSEQAEDAKSVVAAFLTLCTPAKTLDTNN